MSLEFAPQCCDATHYLNLAGVCANMGFCLNNLRPMGIIFWFALPIWLGLPQSILIYANLILIVASATLGAVALKRLCAKAFKDELANSSNKLFAVLLFLSFFIHAVFFLPVWQTALADGPSGALALLAVWMLLLSGLHETGSKVLNSAAGLLLGLSSWMRVYYLYPYLLSLAISLITLAFSSKRRMVLSLLLLGLFPILIQCYKIYERFGYLSFVSRDQVESWTDIHLNDPCMGYDTLLPISGHRWASKCNSELGPWRALLSGKWSDASCLYGGKLKFYFGSYAPETYIFSNSTGLLSFNEEIGDPHGWAASNVKFESNSTIAPDGNNSADKILIGEVKPDTKSMVYAWANGLQSGAYTFSVWLWSDKSTSVDIAIFDRGDDSLIQAKSIRLTETPTRYSITGEFKNNASGDGSLGVMLGKLPGSEATFGTDNKNAFYAWGTKLEAGQLMTNYGTLTLRHWSNLLLVLNAIVLLLTVYFIAYSWKTLGAEGRLAVIFSSSSLGLALLIVPEQRFMILPHVTTWMIASFCAIFIARKFLKRNPNN